MGGGCRARGPVTGGCAFRGAKLALQPIADALHIAHGPILCQGHSWESRPTESSGSCLHRLSLTTQLDGLDIALGGEGALGRAIAEMAARYRPAGIFVYQTCVPAMTGDDVGALCRDMTRKLGCPVVAVEAPGFAGGKLSGIDIAARALMDGLIGTREPERTTPTDIVLIGDYNVAGESREIARLLEKAGIRLLASIPGDGRVGEVAQAHRARLAVTHCSQAMSGLAPALQARWGVPFMEGSFYGAANTARTLRDVAAALVGRGADPGLTARVEALVGAESRKLDRDLAPLLPRLRGKKALLLTGGVKSWSLAGALLDLGLELAGVSLQKTSPGDRARVDDLARPRAIPVLDGLPVEDLDRRLRQGGVDLVLGGGAARQVALSRAVPWVEVNHRRVHPLTGFSGTLALARDIVAAIGNPALAAATRPAPWDAAPPGLAPS